MMWCRLKLMVLLWVCVANLITAQQQNVGGVPLPAGVPSSPNPGVTLDAGGVPLPSPSDAHVSSPVGASQGGVPLPPPHGGAALNDPIVVPLDQGGVPLPPVSSAGAPGSSSTFGTGVPLPPPGAGIGGQRIGGTPVGGLGGAGAPGQLRHVHDPHTDATVQRVLGLPSVRASLQLRTRADKAVKISEVVTAHKQVVTGQLIYLTVRVGETKCPIGTPDLSICALDHTEDSYVCEIVVWERPWLNSSKIIDEKSRCAETEDDNDFKTWGFFSPITSSPSEILLQTLPDGISEQQLGLEAFNYLDRGSESKFRGELVNVNIGQIKFDPLDNSTKIQVRAEYGFNVCLKSPDQKTDPRICPRDTQRDHYVCSVYVVHNPNQISPLEVVPLMEDDREVRCNRKRMVEEELVIPVRAPCLGCPQAAPLTDPTILEIADFALKEYDRSADEDDLHMILKLVKAQTQVVAGVKYYLTMELVETNCKKTLTGVDVNRTFCEQDVTEESKLCDLHVVDQPWVPARDLVAAQCYDKDSYPSSSQDEFIVPVALGTNFAAIPSVPGGVHSRTSIPGGHTPLQLDESTMAIARMVVNEYNVREDDPEYYKLVKVHEASSQVVNGKMYRVVVEMAETNCRKFDPNLGNGEHCIPNQREEHEVCIAKVHEQPPNNNRIVSMSCEDLDDYLRDHLMPTLNAFDVMDHPFLNTQTDQSTVSGTAVPSTNPQVQDVAAFVIRQYNLRGDEDELYVLTNVISAHTEAAAGMTKYLLEIEAAETHCKKYLLVLDPSRCQIDHTEEREVCQAEVSVPADPTQEKQLTRLFCDEREDYYTNKLRGKFFPGSTRQHGATGGTLTGGWLAANVNDSNVKKLGHLIADEFDFRSDEDNLFIFHRMVKAQKQVTSGLKYHLIVELLETVCPKYKRRINKTRCIPDIGEDAMICEADILIQPWLSKQQVMNLQCAEKDDIREGDDSVEVLLPRVHPSAHARPVFKSHFVVRTSDESEESNERYYDPTRSRYSHESNEDLSNETFERFYDPTRSRRRHESNEDLSNETNERFYHPRDRSSKRRHDSEEDDSDELPNFRDRQRRGLPGGYSEADVKDTKVREIADFAVKSMDSLSEDPRVRVVEKIQTVHKQVVSGINYRLEMDIYWTTCLKEDQVEDVSTCLKDDSEQSLSCVVIVYDIPWRQIRRVTEASCNPIDATQQKKEDVALDISKRAAVGGYSEADVNEPKYAELAAYAVQEMDESSSARHIRAVEEIQSVSTQVVAGVNYRMRIKIYWTTCLKTDQVDDASTCGKDSSKPSMTCDIVVYERPWQNFKELSSSSCV